MAGKAVKGGGTGRANPLQSYQEATNQLLSINAERKGNLAEAKSAEMIEAARNNTLAQAAEFVSSSTGNVNVPVNATFNPATVNLLGQYGLGQPKIQKNSSSSQQITKQNVVINNKNTTITNNNVRVPAGIGGPVQSRPIQFQDPSQIRFKNWLSNSFAQQNELAAKRKREYEKRDSALTKNANKLMRKLEDTGKSIATSLNPKNMASSMSKQFKTLMLIMGFGYLAKKWPEVLEKITSIENKIIDFKDSVLGIFSKGGNLVQMLGGKENESVFQAFKNLFLDEKEGLFTYIKLWLGNRASERSTAIKNLTKPDLKWVTGDGIENNIVRILGNVVGYLGDILTAIIDPTQAAGITMNHTAQEASQEYQDNNSEKLYQKSEKEASYWDPNANNGRGAKMGIQVSNGDTAIVEGNYQGLSRNAVDIKGNLVNTPIASISQASEVERAINESRESGNLQTATVATGFSRLMESAKKNKTIPLTEDFVKRYIGDEGIKELGLKPVPYTYILRKKSDEELAMDVLALSKKNASLEKTLIGAGMLGGSFLGGGVPGMATPHVIGGGLTGEAIALVKNLVEKNHIPKYTYELRRGEANYNEVIKDPNNEFLLENDDPKYKAPTIYEVTPEVLQKIINKMSGTDLDVNINNADYVRNVEKSISSKKNPNHSDINVDQLYAPNIAYNEHRQQEHEFAENLRAKRGVEYTGDVVSGVVDQARLGAERMMFNFKKVKPSDVESGDLSGVIEASNNHVFYSNSSDSAGEGRSGPMSKQGHGYIPLGKDLNGFQHKCSSGPTTFYHDGSGGKINLTGLWWNTGSPRTATGTHIDRAGFVPVWNGTREEGYNTASIEKTKFKLEPGDIMLNFGKYKNGTPTSHAQMWNGEQWVSDTYQGQRSFVYREGRLGDISAQIWRYHSKKRVSPVPEDELTPEANELEGTIGAEEFASEENTSAETNISNVTPSTESASTTNSSVKSKESSTTVTSSTPSVSTNAKVVKEEKSESPYLPLPSYTYYTTPTYITPESNVSNDHPTAFSNSGTSSNSGSNFTVKRDKTVQDYHPDFNDINNNLNILKELVITGSKIVGENVNATNNVASSISSLRGGGQQPPYSVSYTDIKTNSKDS